MAGTFYKNYNINQLKKKVRAAIIHAYYKYKYLTPKKTNNFIYKNINISLTKCPLEKSFFFTYGVLTLNE